MNQANRPDAEADDFKKKSGLPPLIMSILAGAIGVQSNKNRERDFQAGDIRKFIIGGLIFTTLFIFILVMIANFAISG